MNSCQHVYMFVKTLGHDMTYTNGERSSRSYNLFKCRDCGKTIKGHNRNE